jgi:hypothetical protein
MRQLSRYPVVATALVCILGASCTSGEGSASPTAAPSSTLDLSQRPGSPAKIRILSPRNGEVVRGDSTELRLSLQNAEVVPATTTELSPDKGHVHVQLNGEIVSMTYGLKQELGGLEPGQYLLRVEFVASDHAPFNPRVFAPAVTFEVKT